MLPPVLTAARRLNVFPGTASRMKKVRAWKFLATAAFTAVILACPAGAFDEDDRLVELLNLAEKTPVEEKALESIYMKNEVLYCTGTGRAAVENNRAADLMGEGKYEEAAAVLESALKTGDALFFPFRYNLGICYSSMMDLKRALLNFQKARYIVPEFSRTYLQIGYILQRWDRDSEAIESFREALRRNSKELETFILIGDVFFRRNQLEMAQKYYDTALRLDGRYPNGLLGRAKIYFKRAQYVKALVMLKSIDTSRPYDKALHYYYAESNFKMRDYKGAAEHYNILLGFRNDRFFQTNSPALIRHKLEISRRLSTRD